MAKIRVTQFFSVLLTLILAACSPTRDADKYMEFVLVWGSKGADAGQFRQPTGVALDKFDKLYVADLGNDRIQAFDNSGKFLYQRKAKDGGVDSFANLHGLIVDAQGNLYVGDTGNNRILKFRISGSGN